MTKYYVTNDVFDYLFANQGKCTGVSLLIEDAGSPVEVIIDNGPTGQGDVVNVADEELIVSRRTVWNDFGQCFPELHLHLENSVPIRGGTEWEEEIWSKAYLGFAPKILEQFERKNKSFIKDLSK